MFGAVKRHKMVTTLVVIAALVGLACDPATPKEDPQGNPKTPAPMADPIPKNAPHSKQPRDKQIRIVFGALLSNPQREVNIVMTVGKATYKRKTNQLSFQEPPKYASPGTTVSINTFNPKVGGETISGYSYCYILVGSPAFTPDDPLSHMEILSTEGCTASYTLKESDG